MHLRFPGNLLSQRLPPVSVEPWWGAGAGEAVCRGSLWRWKQPRELMPQSPLRKRVGRNYGGCPLQLLVSQEAECGCAVLEPGSCERGLVPVLWQDVPLCSCHLNSWTVLSARNPPYTPGFQRCFTNHHKDRGLSNTYLRPGPVRILIVWTMTHFPFELIFPSLLANFWFWLFLDYFENFVQEI